MRARLQVCKLLQFTVISTTQGFCACLNHGDLRESYDAFRTAGNHLFSYRCFDTTDVAGDSGDFITGYASLRQVYAQPAEVQNNDDVITGILRAGVYSSAFSFGFLAVARFQFSSQIFAR